MVTMTLQCTNMYARVQRRTDNEKPPNGLEYGFVK